MAGPAVRDGRSTRWDPHRRERRAAIIAAAIEAIEAHGPDALTGQIAEMAGVPRTHVYRHFDGKQALDLAVSRHVANQIGDLDPGRARDATVPRATSSAARSASTSAGSRRTRICTASSPSTRTPSRPPARLRRTTRRLRSRRN